MNQERLAQLLQACREAVATDEEHCITYATILSMYAAIEHGEVTEGRALHLLGYQAQRLTDEPTHAALYRKAAADIRQMQQEEH